MVAFPVEDRFTKLEEGTVELFVKMGVDAKQMTGEIFFWFTYKRGTLLKNNWIEQLLAIFWGKPMITS